MVPAPFPRHALSQETFISSFAPSVLRSGITSRRLATISKARKAVRFLGFNLGLMIGYRCNVSPNKSRSLASEGASVSKDLFLVADLWMLRLSSRQMSETIGIIAGNGIYPETFVRAARKNAPESKLVAAAFNGETEESLSDMVDALEWFRVGQLGKMIKFFKKEGVTKAIMVGQIAPKNLFDLRPDMRILLMLAKVKKRNAETLFGAIADELAKDGIEIINATTYLEDLLPESGHVCGPKLKKRQQEDAEYGFEIAKESSRLDIGQSVVVRHGTVLAVEAFEGTNECIKRGGKLGRGNNCTLAKVSKPNQDFRFDVPVLGALTIQACSDAGVGVIACEARRTLILGKTEVEQLCKEKGVSIVAL